MPRGRFSTQVDKALQDRVRAAVRGAQRATRRDYSLSQLTEDALTAHCIRLERDHNRGRPWLIPEYSLRRGGRASSRSPRPPFSTQVEVTLLNRVRAAVRGMQQAAGADYSLSQLTEDALTAHCTHLEQLHNDGKPWPAHQQALLPGAKPGR